MPDEPRPPILDKELTTKIVAAYVRTTQLPVLISTVPSALGTRKTGSRIRQSANTRGADPVIRP